MVKDLIPVDIQSFRNATRDINFDVYLKLSDQNIAHVFSRSTGLDYQRLAHYIHKGVKELFIQAEDRQLYDSFVARPAYAVFSDPATPMEKKIATLLNMTEQSMAEIFTELTIQNETAENAKRVIRSYVDLMAESPSSLATILRLVSHGQYLYYHSIAVAILSILTAKSTGQFNQRDLEIIGLGGFLHDVGASQIGDGIVCCATELTPESRKMMQDHPRSGLKAAEGNAVLPEEVRYIIYQHHEQPGGGGYPNGLKENAIYYPAKIVAVADAFSALISNRPHRPAYSVDDAFQILSSAGNVFDQPIVAVLQKALFRHRTNGAKKAA